MDIEKYKIKTSLVISNYILLLGFFFFLTGILFFNSFSAYHTQIYLFLIAPTLILVLINRDWFTPILASTAFQFLLLLFAYSMLSALWNDPAIEDFKHFKRFLIILLFILSLLAISRTKTDKIIILLLIAAGIYSIAAYYSFSDFDFFIQKKSVSSRLIGIGNLSNPLLSSHIYGIFTAFIMTYFLAAKRNWKKDIGLFFLFAGLLSFVLLTQSRTALVGLSATLIVLLGIHRNKYLLYFFFIISGLASIYFILNYDSLVLRGLSYRPEIWAITLSKILENPFFGAGIGTDISIYIEGSKTVFSDTHNIHLGLTYNLGITGLFIWIAFLTSLFMIYLKNKTSLIAQTGIVLLAYGMSAGMTEGMSFFSRPKEVWFLTWLPIALLFVAEYKRLTTDHINHHEITQ